MTLRLVALIKNTGIRRSGGAGRGRPTGSVMPAAFRKLFTASIGDGIGDDVLRSMLPVIAVAVLGAGAFQTSVLNALGMAAFLLLGVPAGVLVDRWSKKSTLVLANTVRAAAVVSVPIAYFLGTLSIWHLFAVAALVSAADVVFTTAQSAMMPTLLKGNELGDGYAKVQSVQSGLAIATPGIVGLIVKVVSAPAMLFVAGAAYLFSAVMTGRLPQDPPSRAETPDKFWTEARDGLGYTLSHPLVRSLMVSVALVNAASMFGAAAKVIFALQILNIPMDQFVFLGALSAAGGLVASMTATRITRRLGLGRTKIAASLASAGFVILLPVAPFLGLAPVVWIGVSGFGWSFFVILSGLAGAGIIPRLVPHHLMGRVMSTYRLFTLGVMPVASIGGGVLALTTGVIPVLWIWALIAAASAIPILVSPIRSWTNFPEELDVHAPVHPETVEPVAAP
ncbi:MFS transporter [uncultured Arthrobacter sp.]|uniref:MFS transporter n=1 Tax=uncultured Arthrobacter sp. TaxID=114050 RepID=UPI0032177A8B